MANNHNFIAGRIPAEGEEIIEQLNKASSEGWVPSHTTCCAIDEENAYLIVMLVQPAPEAPRRGIAMGEHSNTPWRAAANVGTIPGEKPKGSEGS